MRDTLQAFVERFRHRAATTADLLCFLASALSDTPVDTLAAELLDCSSIPPDDDYDADDDVVEPPDPSGRFLEGSETAAAPPLPAADVQGAREWLERLWGWVLQPGLPLLRLELEQGTGNDAAFQTATVTRVQSPFVVDSLSLLLSVRLPAMCFLCV